MTQIQKTDQKNPIKYFFEADNVKDKFRELMGKRSSQFITSVIQVCSNNEMLSKADPKTIYGSAVTAAALDLPINDNLGFAYIVPYREKQKDGSFKVVAQFQMGYKGFVQLAQRSGQFKTISAAPIYEGQLISEDPLRGFIFDFTKKESEKVIGYASFFQLINGFEKTFYMPIAELQKHGKRYSQTFKKGFGLWNDDFDAMALKTVLKLVLSKFAPLSIEMQQAVSYDQAKINEKGDPEYLDNTQEITHEVVSEEKEKKRIIQHIEESKDLKTLEQVKNLTDDEFIVEAYTAKEIELNKEVKK